MTYEKKMKILKDKRISFSKIKKKKKKKKKKKI